MKLILDIIPIKSISIADEFAPSCPVTEQKINYKVKKEKIYINSDFPGSSMPSHSFK